MTCAAGRSPSDAVHPLLQHAVCLPDVAALDRTFLDMVRSMRPDIVTDIGSRDGEFAIACKRASPGSEVHAFEANPENFFEWAAAACREGVVFVPLAIGARRETLELQVPAWASARASACRQYRGVGSTRSRVDAAEHVVYRTPAVPLGEYFALPEHRDRTFAHWVDVEGCSFEVLEGLGQPLADRTLFLKLELETRPFWQGQKLAADCIERCRQLGFLPCAWFDHPDQFDVVFVNERLHGAGHGHR